MSRISPRICCLLILALASSACGAPADGSNATVTATLTKFVLPPEAPPVSAETPTLDPAAPGDSNPAPTAEVPVDSVPTTEAPVNPAATPTTGVFTTPVSPGLPNGPLCNDSIFVDDVTIPDGTVLKPEEEFEKTWRFKNTGICKWTTSYALGFSHGYKMGGTETKLPVAVDPGYTVEITIKMTAPKENGWYGGWWRLKNGIGDNFGDFVFVSVQVSNGQETSTPVS